LSGVHFTSVFCIGRIIAVIHLLLMSWALITALSAPTLPY
jgi:hypothetical protein